MPPDLTSLFDVLFIVIFAALIRAAAVEQAAATPAPAPTSVAAVQQPDGVLHEQALAQIDAELAARPTVIARVSVDGKLTAVESGNKKLTLDVPLLEHSLDPDVALAYLGDRSVELRLCRQIALYLSSADLANYLVIIAPAARAADLPHALHTGLHRDVDRCQTDQHGLAVIVEPTQGTRGAAP
ncbi:hypothetical protein BH11MYX1_BH11MYX1_42970 [soil metagenome]